MLWHPTRTVTSAFCCVAFLCAMGSGTGGLQEPVPPPEPEALEELPEDPASALRLKPIFVSEAQGNRSVALSHDGTYLAWAAYDSLVVDLSTDQVVWRWKRPWELESSIGLLLHPTAARLIWQGVGRLSPRTGWVASKVAFTAADTMMVASHGGWLSDKQFCFGTEAEAAPQESLWKLGPYVNLYRIPRFERTGIVELQPPAPATLPPEQHVGVRGWDLTPSGKYVVTVDDLTTVRLLDPGTGQTLREVSLDGLGDVGRVDRYYDNQQVDVTEKHIAVSGRRWELFLLSLEEFEPLDVYWAGDAIISSLCFSPNGQYLAATWNNGMLRVWDVLAAEPVHAWQAPDPQSTRGPTCAWSADSASVLLFNEPQTGLDLVVWKLDVRGTSREAAILVERFPLPAAYTNFTVSADTRYMAMAHAYPRPACSEGTICVYQTPEEWLPAPAQPKPDDEAR